MTKPELETKVKELEQDNKEKQALNEKLQAKVDELTEECDQLALEKENLGVGVIKAYPAPISIVWPYVAEREKNRHARWEELKMSIRSVEENCQFPFQIVVVGDKEPWMDLEKIHFIESPRGGDDNPPRDIAIKLKAVINDPEVSENFVWMNDDICFINPVRLEDIQILKVEGMMAKKEENFLYGRNWNKTMHLLLKHKKPTYNYATHSPYYFNKEMMTELMVKFNLIEESHLITILYHNYFFPDAFPISLKFDHDNWKLSIFRSDARWKKLPHHLNTKKFLNYNNKGLTETLKEALTKLFPKPSSYEAT